LSNDVEDCTKMVKNEIDFMRELKMCENVS